VFSSLALAALSIGLSDFGNINFISLVGHFAVRLSTDSLTASIFHYRHSAIFAVGDICNLLLPVFDASRSRMERLKVVNHEKLDALLVCLEPELRETGKQANTCCSASGEC
jgi:hypothetical protein